MTSAPRLAVVGARLVDLEPAQTEAVEATLLIEGGRVADWLAPVPVANAEILDATGLWAMPGLIDAGVYPFPAHDSTATSLGAGLAGWVQRAIDRFHRWLAAGVTTVRSAGAVFDLDLELRALLAAGSIAGPRLLASGAPILIDGAADDARRAARLRIKAGADLLTVRVGEAATEAAERAIIEEAAHARTPVVFAAPAPLLPLCRSAGGHAFEGSGGTSGGDLAAILVRDLETDEVAVASYGGDRAEEATVAAVVMRLIESGWPPPRALRAATLGGARLLGRDDEIGSLAPGRRADVLLLESDPLTDPAALARVRGVLLAGRVAYWRDGHEGGGR